LFLALHGYSESEIAAGRGVKVFHRIYVRRQLQALAATKRSPSGWKGTRSSWEVSR